MKGLYSLAHFQEDDKADDLHPFPSPRFKNTNSLTLLFFYSGRSPPSRNFPYPFRSWPPSLLDRRPQTAPSFLKLGTAFTISKINLATVTTLHFLGRLINLMGLHQPNITKPNQTRPASKLKNYPILALGLLYPQLRRLFRSQLRYRPTVRHLQST